MSKIILFLKYKNLIFMKTLYCHYSNNLRRFYFLFSLFIGLISFQSISHAQDIEEDDITPLLPSIILYILSENNECPSVTPETTISGFQLISTQEDLNALEGITRIEGTLSFRLGLEALDFSPLDSLVEIASEPFRVNGSLDITNTNLTKIEGFNCLQDIARGFSIESNDSLVTLSGFEKLTNFSGLSPQLRVTSNPLLTEVKFNALTSDINSSSITIENNLSLETVEFERLTAVNSLRIRSNVSLKHIIGFSDLNFIAFPGIDIQQNNALISISDFPALTTVTADIVIATNAKLVQFPAFPNLTTVRDLTISGNESLTSISSNFNSLTTVLEDLRINSNSQITEISGFESLTSIRGALDISGNSSLTSISDFPMLTDVGLDQSIPRADLQISDNNSLDSFPEFLQLESLGENLLITGNESLVSISSFPKLTNIRDVLLIGGNNALIQVTGFDALELVGSDQGFTFSFAINDNESLRRITGFSSLISTGRFSIFNNRLLESIEGFSFLEGIRASNLLGRPAFDISSNPILLNVNGFNSFMGPAVSIKSNFLFDCTKVSAFIPSLISTNNLVNCPEETGGGFK